MKIESFETWMAHVDSVIERVTGGTTDDMPDITFLEWFEDGMGSTAAAYEAMRASPVPVISMAA